MSNTNSPPPPGVSGCLPMPASFPFPFPAYSIQEDFMKALFRCLDEARFGVFESPTGTGKSLSLICGALTWFHAYEDHRRAALRKRIDLLAASTVSDDGDGDDWFAAAVKRNEDKSEMATLRRELVDLEEKEQRMEDLRRRRKAHRVEGVRKVEQEFDDLFGDMDDVRKAVRRELEAIGGDESYDAEDEEIILQDYDSDNEVDESRNKKRNGLIEDEEEKEDFSLRIYYCSRTHSQLSQFVKEIQKSPFSDNVRLVPLASRAIMCINESVKALGGNALINERCLEMQQKSSSKAAVDDDADDKAVKLQRRKKKTGTGGRCPFHKQSTIETLRDQALLKVLDIEELVSHGKRLNACPYYASRHATKDAQIIVLPYNTLLHKPTRDAIGLRLKGSVVIVDEAHNLLDTITHIHSAEVTGRQLCMAHTQLSQYMERYRSRLNPKNLLYVKQIRLILKNMMKLFGCKVTQGPAARVGEGVRDTQNLLSVVGFMTEADIFNQDLNRLVNFMTKSKIAQKLHGFAEKYKDVELPKSREEEQNVVKRPERGIKDFLKSVENKKCIGKMAEHPKSETKSESTTIAKSSLVPFVQFVDSLCKFSAEARILLQPGATAGECAIKYCLLDPASKFRDLVDECRSIIVAGGTMQPTSEFKDRLFIASGASPERISNFSCGHVIPPQNLLPLVIPSGPCGHRLDFTHGSRDKDDTIDELYRVLLNATNIIPGGVVCFFPSYDYEERVRSFFEKKGYLEKLTARKRIFREPKRSDQMDAVLRDYGLAARGKSGALLFSVVGGKMSEGINFGDDLGRCVVMVGLPFPNSNSPELKEKMAYLNETVACAPGGKRPGQVHYENLCMKAVNQSIGRAIRHKEDYATLLLLDHRYARPEIRAQLPGWIRGHVKVAEKFGHAIPLVTSFFRGKKHAERL